MGARFRIFQVGGIEAPGGRSFATVRGALKIASVKAVAEHADLVVWVCLDGKTPSAIGGVARRDGRTFRVPGYNAVPPVQIGQLSIPRREEAAHARA